MKAIIITAVIGMVCCCLAAAHDHAALSVTVWEHCNQLLESLVMTSTKSTRLAEECLVTTGSALLVYTKSIVIWNYRVWWLQGRLDEDCCHSS